MKKYFNNVKNLSELRKKYKELLKKEHPDNANGSKEVTQAINAEYDRLFKVLKDRHKNKTTDRNKTSFDNMKYDFKEFHDIFKGHFTRREILDMQKVAFQNYEDAHGHKPIRKDQKEIAYSFIRDLLYNMEVCECVDYLKSFGISESNAIKFWESLE